MPTPVQLKRDALENEKKTLTDAIKAAVTAHEATVKAWKERIAKIEGALSELDPKSATKAEKSK